MANVADVQLKDTGKEVPCKICERPTLLRESHLCNTCNTLISILVAYKAAARQRLETVVAREASWV